MNVADLSSAQNSFDASAYAASGRQAVIIKSTESTSYHFAKGDTWEVEALGHGLVVGRYHWAGSSLRGTIQNPDIEGDYFLQFNGGHTPGRFAACDMENPLPGHGPALYGLSAASAAAWVDEFLDHIAAKGGWPGLGYSFLGTGVVQRIRHAKWYAAYPGPVPSDKALHQFTDAGPVPGVGSCDDSYCFIDLRAFAGTQQPTEEEEDMGFVIGADGRNGNYLRTGSLITPISDEESAKAYIAAGAKPVKVSGAEFDHTASLAH